MAKPVEIVVNLSKELPGSLSTKILNSLRESINTGVLRPGDMLPPSRVLASNLGVSRGTVVAAYEQLTAEGYLDSAQGSSTRVHPNLELFHGVKPFSGAETNTVLQAIPKKSRPLRDERDPQQTIGDLTKRAAWRSAWRNAATSPELEYELPVEGSPELLTEIAEHLRAMRATVRGRDEILVTGGAREGLGLLLTALGTTRGRQLMIGVEEGGATTLRDVAKQHGSEIVLLPVDEHGLLVSAIPDAVLDAVIVTPSHQYPQGAALPLHRRRELVAWGRRNGALVIEDDFDSELRFLHAPLPTLAALDDAHEGTVATLGSFSATLSISLAAGFLIIPGSLRNHILTVRKNLGSPVAPILQIALASLLQSGELRRHVARLRRKRAASEGYAQLK